MLEFKVDYETCIGCGQCASDCPAMIITMDDKVPSIAADLEKFCIGCKHCVAICSEGSVSILGVGPNDGMETKETTVASDEMELLIKSRRSVRNYRAENVPVEIIEKLVNVSAHAPSGHNDRELLYTIVDTPQKVDELREEAIAGLELMIAEGRLPEGMEMFKDIINAWKEGGKDILFRGAPHLLVVSALEECAAPLHDSIIGLTTFELYAQTYGIGTIWNGLATLTITELVPSLMETLNIPADHRVGYVMGFGYPAVGYKRTIDRGTPEINWVR